MSFFTFYPDTKALKRLENYAENLKLAGTYHFSVPEAELNLSGVDNATLNKMQKIFYREIILNPRYIVKHLILYGLFYLRNPLVFCSLSRIGRYLMRPGK